jgi:hypothetical protein
MDMEAGENYSPNALAKFWAPFSILQILYNFLEVT